MTLEAPHAATPAVRSSTAEVGLLGPAQSGSAPTPPARSNPAGQVSFGIASGTGYGVTVAALITAVLTYLTGDHSQAQLGPIVSAAVAVISLGITQIGRYVQANTQIRTDGELNKIDDVVSAVLHAVEQRDPAARSQLDEVVRRALQEELQRLSGTPQVVAEDVERIVLPTLAEETAHQPPSPS